jgi:hypothetical protein
MRRLLLVLLSSAIVLSACGQSKSWPGGSNNALSQPPSAAATTVAPTEAPPTEAPPTEAPPTEAPLPGWIAFSPTDSGFTVLMPGQPTLATSTINTAAGDAPASTWTYEVSNDLVYVVTQARFPTGSVKTASAKSVFDTFVNGMLSSTTGATLSDSADTTLGGRPGRAFTIDTAAVSLKGIAYINNDDLDIVYAGYTPAISDMTEIDAFLASFNFTI